MHIRRTIAALLIVGAISWHLPVAYAATPEEIRIQELQQKLAELQAQQDKIRGDLGVTQQQKQTLQNEINNLLGQIRLVENQISATDKKIQLSQTEIDQVQGRIQATQEDISRKRETIGRMVLFLEQRDRESLVASLFKYANLSDFLQQFHDLATVQDRLMGTVEELQKETDALETDKEDLESRRKTLEDLNEEALQRRNQLAGVKSERDKVLKTTKGQEAAYQKQIEAIEKQKAAFFKELRELELKAISGGLYIVHIKAATIPPKGTKLFAWPESGYHLTQGYGMTTYARRGAYGGAPHNGIDISAGFGTPIKSIGAGMIVANGSNSGWGNWVAIQHPNNMVSVYGHMSSLSPLKVGTQVAQGQVIGYEGKTGNATGYHLHLSLYRDFFTYLKDGTNELYFNYFDGSVNPLDYL